MKRIKNVQAILTDYKTELPDAQIALSCYSMINFKRNFRVLNTRDLLAIVSRNFDRDKLVSTLNHATQDLKLRQKGI